MSPKKICRKKFSWKKFFEKQNSKKNLKCQNLKILKFWLSIFLYLKKKSVEIRLIFENKIEKNFENNFCKFFIFEKTVGLKSVNLPIKG